MFKLEWKRASEAKCPLACPTVCVVLRRRRCCCAIFVIESTTTTTTATMNPMRAASEPILVETTNTRTVKFVPVLTLALRMIERKTRDYIKANFSMANSMKNNHHRRITMAACCALFSLSLSILSSPFIASL